MSAALEETQRRYKPYPKQGRIWVRLPRKTLSWLLEEPGNGFPRRMMAFSLQSETQNPAYRLSNIFLYREQEGFVNLGSASQRKIDPNERDHCTSCKASEEDRFYAGVASPNSQNLPARGI